MSKDPLQLETERQNRIYQEALELKRMQALMAEARKTLQIEGKRPEEIPAPRAQEQSKPSITETPVSETPIPECGDIVVSIPRLRSTVLPLDESDQGDWSPPFYLRKLDMEPWTSYLSGYRKSRLFLEPSFANGNEGADEDSELHVDFPVRALLELSQFPVSALLDPLVQIDGQVEYIDLGDEVRTCRDPRLARSLAESGLAAHRRQLASAYDIGLQLGNHLYDTLLGEGLSNLTLAWEAVYSRRPTIDELHQMLTTGRVNPIAEVQ